MLGTCVTNVFVFFLIHFSLLLSALQVRKELEMSGIEFYPQKEFDDDMEDKSDNDKIRVSCCVLSLTRYLSSDFLPWH